jgi:hypothetical protein
MPMRLRKSSALGSACQTGAVEVPVSNGYCRKSGRGHSKTLREIKAASNFRQPRKLSGFECGCPLPLFRAGPNTDRQLQSYPPELFSLTLLFSSGSLRH